MKFLTEDAKEKVKEMNFCIIKGAFLIITHNAKILENLKIDYTHILVKGHIVHTGDGSLVEKINAEGFEQFLKN